MVAIVDLGLAFMVVTVLLFDAALPTHNNNVLTTRIAGGYELPEVFEADFQRIKLDCYDSSRDGDDRQESHLKFLVLAAAFATADRWMIALGHARRAISIIERSRRLWSPIPVLHRGGAVNVPKSHMSGREAYFLAAVCQRILSNDESDIARAAKYLEKAEEALVEDHAHTTAANVNNTRFVNERVSLALSRYYLARSRDPKNLCDNLVKDIYFAAAILLDLLGPTLFRDGRDHHQPVTWVSIAAHFIQVCVIREFRRLEVEDAGVQCPVTIDMVGSAVDVIKRLTSASPSVDGFAVSRIIATTHIRAYMLVGEMLCTKEKAQLEWLRDRLKTLLADVDAVAVTRYDSWRFDALLKFAARFTASKPG